MGNPTRPRPLPLPQRPVRKRPAVAAPPADARVQRTDPGSSLGAGGVSSDLAGLVALLQSIDQRLFALTALTAQYAGAPLKAPLPRAKGVRGIPDPYFKQLVLNAATVTNFLPADPNRRRFVVYSTSGVQHFIGPTTDLAAGASTKGILLSSGGATNWATITEELHGELVRFPWYVICATPPSNVYVFWENIL